MLTEFNKIQMLQKQSYKKQPVQVRQDTFQSVEDAKIPLRLDILQMNNKRLQRCC